MVFTGGIDQLIKQCGVVIKNAYLNTSLRDMGNIINNIAIEHRWNESEVTGEISMIDNRTALHASYERTPSIVGYHIGVYYCANAEEFTKFKIV